jgi:aspartyl-tRNA(Asn)/glutamyl-tRNA(Gln) amidotransferase subunit C
VKLTNEQVRHVAQLARLGLSDTDLEALSGELSGILDYIDKLAALNTDHIPPTARVDDLGNVWREDEARDSLDQGVAVANAPDAEGGYFRVKAMQD